MSSFLLERDYFVLITEEQIGQITENETIKNDCLEQSYEEVKEYLRHRFNVEFDMRYFTIPPDANSVAASVDDRLYNNTADKLYICIQESTAQPLTNTDYFTNTDDRNKKLVQITADVFLYHLHTRLNPRMVPQHRKIRYDGDGDIHNAMSAIKWLLMVQKGTIAPNLTPALDDDGEQLASGQSIIYGSSPKDDFSPDTGGGLAG